MFLFGFHLSSHRWYEELLNLGQWTARAKGLLLSRGPCLTTIWSLKYFKEKDFGVTGQKKKKLKYWLSSFTLYVQYAGVCNQLKVASNYTSDFKLFLYKHPPTPHPHFYFIYVPDKKQPELLFFWTNLKAYCYSLWSSRWKMPHFFFLVLRTCQLILSVWISPRNILSLISFHSCPLSAVL